jgi:predicted DNA-binding transcriptional regulator AlpA
MSLEKFVATGSKGAKSPPVTFLPPLPDQMLTTQEAAAFCGFSVSHWRQMFGTGQAPPPIRLSERKLVWRLSDLRAWITSKAAAD